MRGESGCERGLVRGPSGGDWENVVGSGFAGLVGGRGVWDRRDGWSGLLAGSVAGWWQMKKKSEEGGGAMARQALGPSVGGGKEGGRPGSPNF